MIFFGQIDHLVINFCQIRSGNKSLNRWPRGCWNHYHLCLYWVIATSNWSPHIPSGAPPTNQIHSPNSSVNDLLQRKPKWKACWWLSLHSEWIQKWLTRLGWPAPARLTPRILAFLLNLQTKSSNTRFFSCQVPSHMLFLLPEMHFLPFFTCLLLILQVSAQISFP